MKKEPQVYLDGSTIYLLQQGIPMIAPDGTKRYGRVRVSTGLTIVPDKWNPKEGRPSLQHSVQDGFSLTGKIEEQLAKMTAAYQHAEREGDLRPERIRDEFQQLAKPNRPTVIVPVRVEAGVSALMTEIEKACRDPKSRNQSANFRHRLEEFDASASMLRIDDQWRTRFYGFLRAERGYSDNSMWNAQKHLNKLILFSQKKGIKTKLSTDRQFKLTSAITDWLDWSDLARIVAHVPSTPRLMEAKTFALLGAFTSIRISDYPRFFENLSLRNGIYCSQFKCTKSPSPLVMPIVLLPLADQLREAGIPKNRSEQGIRDAVQDLVNEAGIAKVITPHCLRRSFISNMLAGAPEIGERILCSLFTGHQIGGSERKVFAGYNQGGLIADAALFVRLAKTINPENTGGMRLV
jgi:hypothetical protein